MTNLELVSERSQRLYADLVAMQAAYIYDITKILNKVDGNIINAGLTKMIFNSLFVSMLAIESTLTKKVMEFSQNSEGTYKLAKSELKEAFEKVRASILKQKTIKVRQETIKDG